jgi:RNA polymerase sigma factor (sigma-70 family)
MPMNELRLDEDAGRVDGTCMSEHIERLRPALIARHGPQLGIELLSEVSEYAWAQRGKLDDMANPVGYLYRVSQSNARRHRRWAREVQLPPEIPEHDVDDHPLGADLHTALAQLGPDDRTIVVLVHSYRYHYDEVAEIIGKSPAAVRNRLHRSMVRLRRHLEQESPHAHR